MREVSNYFRHALDIPLRAGAQVALNHPLYEVFYRQVSFITNPTLEQVLPVQGTACGFTGLLNCSLFHLKTHQPLDWHVLRLTILPFSLTIAFAQVFHGEFHSSSREKER